MTGASYIRELVNDLESARHTVLEEVFLRVMARADFDREFEMLLAISQLLLECQTSIERNSRSIVRPEAFCIFKFKF